MNRALRIITFTLFGRVKIKPIYKDFKIPNVTNILFMEIRKHMFKLKK